MLKLVSLFSGAGGLDLGLEAAGFKVLLCVDNDRYCQQTLQLNRPRWRLAEPADIFALEPKQMLRQAGLKKGEVDLLAGGPPCQPFSKAGYWRHGDSLRLRDPRAKTLNAYTRIVATLLPKVILLENVEGIKFSNKDQGLQLLRRHLRAINRNNGTKYDPVIFTLNAADFGVPQIRKRVFLVACRNGKKFDPPVATHGAGRLREVTAGDAIGDLADGDAEDLAPKGSWTELLPSIPEGENYLWHTDRGGGQPLFGFRTRFWSFLLKLSRDKPSWTIPAQPGPSTGPFHWTNRLLSACELARLQTFPDEHEFVGSRLLVQRQIGNAVPPLLAEHIGRAIAAQFFKIKPHARLAHAITRRLERSPTLTVCAVPKKYVDFIGAHPAHPGVGKGPGAIARRQSVEPKKHVEQI